MVAGRSQILDHALYRVFACEMGNIREEVGVENGEVDNPLDARLPGEAEREQRLCEFVGCDGIQQEKRACLRDGLSCRLHIHEVGLNGSHPAGKLRLFGRAGQGVNLGPFRGQIGDNARSDCAGAAGYENGHGDAPDLSPKN